MQINKLLDNDDIDQTIYHLSYVVHPQDQDKKEFISAFYRALTELYFYTNPISSGSLIPWLAIYKLMYKNLQIDITLFTKPEELIARKVFENTSTYVCMAPPPNSNYFDLSWALDNKMLPLKSEDPDNFTINDTLKLCYHEVHIAHFNLYLTVPKHVVRLPEGVTIVRN